MFQGDSITDGNRGRSADPNHILGHGYVFIIAAKYGAAFPEAKLEFFNRGVSGNTVLDLEKRWQKDTLDLKADVLSILIGVNDKGRGVPPERYEETYDKLLSAANPQLKLALCEPFVVNHRATTPQHGSPNADLVKHQKIVARLAAQYGAALVHFQAALDRATERAPANHWIWDDIHPTYSSHQILVFPKNSIRRLYQPTGLTSNFEARETWPQRSIESLADKAEGLNQSPRSARMSPMGKGDLIASIKPRPLAGRPEELRSDPACIWAKKYIDCPFGKAPKGFTCLWSR